ncbi:MAG TPA: protein phosphatase 2C domain-containing protein [Ktedonobacterales bacterium]|jgi:protein phosphatase|nr:protein phosphatase 2C domain-containing protein [Ktedonobacterales bacterium]
MPLRLMAAGKTDTGLQREQNEDSLYIQVIDDGHPASGVFIVSDGMGGYHAGEVASQLAVETIRDELLKLFADTSDQTTIKLDKGRSRKGSKSGKLAKRDAAKTRPLSEVAATPEDSGTSDAAAIEPAAAQHVVEDTNAAATDTTDTTDTAQASDAVQATDAAADDENDDAVVTRHLMETVVRQHFGDKLRVAVENSSQAIVDYGAHHREARGMGATVTAALVMDGQAFIANVGDSRTYLLRDGKLQRVTRDHSLVARLVEAGQIEPDEVYDHPSRNLIYRSLGAGHAEVDVDIFDEHLRAGDALLLCSDGLWEMIRDPQILQIISETDDVEQACESLIKVANENGGEDNITGVLVRCVEA